jgi:uncharacterized protein (TIGR00725 family)
VCGGSRAGPDDLQAAEAVGARLAAAGAVLLCGGLGGVMQAAARGARSAGGLTIGILPGSSAADANPDIVVPLATGLGEARNAILVRAAEAVIAIGGEWGTLSEIALARRMGVPVVLLRPGLAASLPLPTAQDAEDAVGQALAAARLPGAG